MKTSSTLQRGMACLSCRKRKMKCDGARPVCTQCRKSDRSSECRYHEQKHTSRTQLLQQKVAKLEARLRELESEQPESSGGSASSSSPSSLGDVPLSLSTPFDDPYSSQDYFVTGSSTSGVLSQDLSLSRLSPDITSVFAQYPSSSSSSESAWSHHVLDLPSSTDAALERLQNLPLDISSLPPQPSSLLEQGVKWWEDPHVFCDNKRRLLEIFFSHRQQCAFDVHTDRFTALLSATSNHRPHPALMDAIYLLACYFSRSPRLTELEAHFSKRALQGISDALHASDRVVHVLQASCLLAVYFFCRGRVLEGYYHSSVAARLALDLGLHQVSSIDGLQLQMALSGNSDSAPAPVKASSPLSPPVDSIEYAERVAAFWQIFTVDRTWSVATGLPTAMPDDDHPNAKISTAWPMPIVDVPIPNLAIPERIEHNPLLFSDELRRLTDSYTRVTLRAKAVALFERSAKFSSSSMRNDLFWLEHRTLEMSIAQFSANLPCIGKHGEQSMLSKTDIDLVDIHTLIHVATIHLNRGLIEINSSSYERCLVSANAVTSIIRELNEDDFDFLNPISSTCWRCVADVFIRILSSPHTQALQCAVDAIDGELDVLVTAMRRLGTRFAIAGIHAAKTDGDRIRARAIAEPS